MDSYYFQHTLRISLLIFSKKTVDGFDAIGWLMFSSVNLQCANNGISIYVAFIYYAHLITVIVSSARGEGEKIAFLSSPLVVENNDLD